MTQQASDRTTRATRIRLRVASGALVVCLVGGGVVQAQPPPARTSSGTLGEHYAHTIVRGDTLIGLAHQLMTDVRDWPKIARLNRVRDARRLRPGRTLLFPVTWLRGLPGQAEVLWVRGQPRVEGAGQATVALLGTAIPPGSTVATGEGDAVRLRLSTGGEVTVGERARVTLVELRTIAGSVKRTLLDVRRGRMESTVLPQTHPQQRHEVRTPLVNATVRGTEFRVAVDDDDTTITEVTAGVVGVGGRGQPVVVGAGFGIRATGDESTLTPTPLLPAPDFPSPPLTVTRLPVRARWAPTTGAVAYRVRIVPAEGGPPVVDTRIAGTDVSWPDLEDAAYTLVVRAVDANGIEGLDAHYPLVVDAHPLPPIVRDASGAAPVYGDTLPLRWTQSTDASGVDVQVASDSTFSAPVFEQSDIKTPEIAVPLPPGRYAWRIATRQGDRRGPWGDAVSAELRARPRAGPPPAAQLLGRELTLQWSAGLAGDRYAVQVSADPDFATTMVDTVVDAPTLTLPRPAAGRYHVRVRVVNDEGVEGPYGPTQSLDVVDPPRRRSTWWWLLVPAGVAGVVLGAR